MVEPIFFCFWISDQGYLNTQMYQQALQVKFVESQLVASLLLLLYLYISAIIISYSDFFSTLYALLIHQEM